MSRDILVALRYGLSPGEQRSGAGEATDWGFSEEYVDRLRADLLRFRGVGPEYRDSAASTGRHLMRRWDLRSMDDTNDVDPVFM